MIEFDALETIVGSSGRLSILLPIASPVTRGYVDAWLSPIHGGPPAAPALVRQLVTTDGVLPPLALAAADVRSAFPRGGRAWLVASYAGRVIGSGAVVLVV